MYSANLVHVFSPTLTNEFVFAEATFLNPIILGNPAAVNPSRIGFYDDRPVHQSIHADDAEYLRLWRRKPTA